MKHDHYLSLRRLVTAVSLIFALVFLAACVQEQPTATPTAVSPNNNPAPAKVEIVPTEMPIQAIQDNNSPLGMNLYYVSYYDTLMPFVELTRQGSQWISFDGNKDAWNDDRSFPTDENGYPTALEADQDLRMIIFIEARPEMVPAGEYTLSWEGNGRLAIVANGEKIPIESSNPTTFSWQPTEEFNNLFLIIEETEPNDHLRNIRLYAPGYNANSDTIFSPHMKNLLEPFEPIRLMDWSSINDNNKVVEWADRAQMDNYTWGLEGDFGENRGVPYEVQIALANELQKDIWITIPHQASDDFVRQLATLIDEQMDPHLRVYIEYTNEHWNSWFSQNWWIYEQANQEPDNHGYEDGYSLFHFYARRSSEIFMIFNEVIPDEARVVNVLSGMAYFSWPLQEADAELERLNRWHLVDAVALAPYWPLSTEEDDTARQLAIEAMADNVVTEDEYAAIFAELTHVVDSIFDPQTEGGLSMIQNKEIIDKHNLPLIAYEGGQHIVSWGEEFEGDPVLGDFPNRINGRPEMYALYQQYLNSWKRFGGGNMTMYHLVGAGRESESFGHLRDYAQPLEEAHKYRALLDWIEKERTTQTN